MNRYVWVLIFLAGVVAGALANRCAALLRRPSPPQPADIVAHFARDLSLDEAQKARALALFMEEQPKMEALHAKMRAAMDEARAEMDSRLTAILSPEQKQKFAALQAKWSAENHDGNGPEGPPPPR